MSDAMSSSKSRSLREKVRRIFVQKSLDAARRWYRLRRDGRFDMMTADWDVLVLLDACHPDILREELEDEFGRDATFDTRHSRGTDSSEFIHNQFAGHSFHDTVYVTGNPYLSILPEGTFHATDNVLADEFDPEIGTVPPHVMVNRTLQALNRYPKKRIITHFMQPHFPFLGETGQKFAHNSIELGTSAESDTPNPWFGAMYGLLDPNEVVTAYRENHCIAISHISNLITSVSDKIVVSADHANLIGQRLRPIPIRAYGHPSGLAHPDLTRVPWVKIPATDVRRRVSVDLPVASRERDKDLGDKLAALGYK